MLQREVVEQQPLVAVQVWPSDLIAALSSSSAASPAPRIEWHAAVEFAYELCLPALVEVLKAQGSWHRSGVLWLAHVPCRRLRCLSFLPRRRAGRGLLLLFLYGYRAAGRSLFIYFDQLCVVYLLLWRWLLSNRILRSRWWLLKVTPR